RLQRCLARQEEISGEINAAQIGQVEKVLVESVSKRSETDMVGRTMGDKSVVFPGRQELIGATVTVRIVASHPHTLFGEMANLDGGMGILPMQHGLEARATFGI